MINYLALQTTYEELQIGLFADHQFLFYLSKDKKENSTSITTEIDELLKISNLTLQHLSFIVANQGPAPFTSLRVVLATVNGLGFASNVPLIGVDGLEAFVHEQSDDAWPQTVVLINAYNQDVYYAIQKKGQGLHKGCAHTELAIPMAHKMLSDGPVRFIGNGVALCRELIEKTFRANAYIPEPLPDYVSLEQIAQEGSGQWQRKESIAHQLLPCYLKKLSYKKSIVSHNN